MQQVQIIATHPRKDSLIVSTAQTIHSKIKSDFCHLDTINYNPLLLEEEIMRRASFEDTTVHFQNVITQVRTLVLCYPDWWGLPPARLVGWIQRVFSAGVAFLYAEKDNNIFELQKNLSHLQIIYLVTSDEEKIIDVEKSIDILQDRFFRHAGIHRHQKCILHNTHKSSLVQKKQWANDALNVITQLEKA